MLRKLFKRKSPRPDWEDFGAEIDTLGHYILEKVSEDIFSRIISAMPDKMSRSYIVESAGQFSVAELRELSEAFDSQGFKCLVIVK